MGTLTGASERPHLFDASRCLEHVKALGIPRFVGTGGERWALAYLEDQLRRAGYSPQSRPVVAYLLPMPVLQRLLGICATILLLLSTAALTSRSMPSPWAGTPLLLSVCFLAVELLLASGVTECGLNLGRGTSTKNVLAECPPRGPAKLEVVLYAHSDSKSQLFPLAWRTAFQVLGLYAGTLLGVFLTSAALIGVAGRAVESLAGTWIWGLATPVILALACWSANFIGNGSPGADDNASGMGVLLELARVFKDERLEATKITFLFDAAEEVGLYGSKAFIGERKQALRRPGKSNTFFLNLDTVGGGLPLYLLACHGIPKKCPAKRFTSILEQAAARAGVPLKTVYVPLGDWGDSYHPRKAGLPTVTLVASGGAKRTHSKRDTYDEVDGNSLASVGGLVEVFLKKLDESLNK
ncbi:MAG: M28 family metallopeptidase [Promethearchaeota archaeon]